MLSDVYKIFLPCFLASCGLDIYINSNIWSKYQIVIFDRNSNIYINSSSFCINNITAKDQINLI